MIGGSIILYRALADQRPTRAAGFEKLPFTYDALSRPVQLKRCIRPQTVSSTMCHLEKTGYDRYGRVHWSADASSEALVEGSFDLATGAVAPVPGEIYRGTRPVYGTGIETSAAGVPIAAGFQYQLSEIVGVGAAPAKLWHEVLAGNARGQVTEQRLHGSDSWRVSQQFDPDTGWLRSIKSGVGPTHWLQDLVYSYDELGNLRTRRDRSDGRDIEEDSTWATNDAGYDALNRLLRTHLKVGGSGAVTGTQVMTYSSSGNLLSKSGSGPYAAGQVSGYQYGAVAGHGSHCAAGGPHAVGAVNGNRLFCYDANGNQTATRESSQVVRQIAYTLFDKPARIDSLEVGGPGHATLYRYGAARELVSRVDAPVFAGTAALNGELEVLYLGGVELEVSRTGGSAASTTQAQLKYQRYIGGVAIESHSRTASFQADGSWQASPTGTPTVDLLFKDNLGSSHLVLRLNATGGESERKYQAFDAWGMRRDAATASTFTLTTAYTQFTPTDGNETRTRKGFTGHEMVDGAGIVHMGGRIYDRESTADSPSSEGSRSELQHTHERLLGRFLQADPIIQDPLNSQSYNRYTYVFNNPLSLTDPSGYRSLSMNLQMYWRPIATTIIVAVAWQFMPAINATQCMNPAVLGKAAAIAASSGAAVGYINTGTLRGSVLGAVESILTVGIKANLATESWGGLASNMGAHSLKGGLLSELSSGDFGHGFRGAAFNKISGIAIENSGIKGFNKQIALEALAGGLFSQATGGKFGNGAASAAIQYAFNEVADRAASSDDSSDSQVAEDFLLEENKKAGDLFCQAKCYESADAAHAAAGNRYLGASISAKREAAWRVYSLVDGTFSFSYPGLGPFRGSQADFPPRKPELALHSNGHSHWDSNPKFSPQDWRHTTQDKRSGPGYTLYLAARNGTLQYTTPRHARGFAKVRGSAYLPPDSNFAGFQVSGVQLKTTFP